MRGYVMKILHSPLLVLNWDNEHCRNTTWHVVSGLCTSTMAGYNPSFRERGATKVRFLCSELSANCIQFGLF